jgi:hypothetical protein
VVLGQVTGGHEDRMEPIDQAHALPGTMSPGPAAEPLPTMIDREIEVAEPGRVVLDVNRVSFEIVPGPAGEPIRLEGRYNAGRYNLTESYETYGETGWVYRVGIDERGIGLRPYIQTDDDEDRVTLIVPRDAPFMLEGRIGIGQSDLELGGLWLIDVELEFGVGDHTVRFDESLPIPMGRLRLDTSIGVINVREVGNASPREVWVKHSVGETRVDLRGAWRRDAEVFVNCGIGECDVRVPTDVGLAVDRASVMLGESSRPPDRAAPEPGAPTLQLSVSATIGQVRVR